MHFKSLFKFITRFFWKKYSKIKISDFFCKKKMKTDFVRRRKRGVNANKRHDAGVKISDVANVWCWAKSRLQIFIFRDSFEGREAARGKEFVMHGLDILDENSEILSAFALFLPLSSSTTYNIFPTIPR